MNNISLRKETAQSTAFDSSNRQSKDATSAFAKTMGTSKMHNAALQSADASEQNPYISSERLVRNNVAKFGLKKNSYNSS